MQLQNFHFQQGVVPSDHIIPILLAGGNGSRLWPLSREQFPKQFHSFDDKHTLLQASLNRISKLGLQSPFIICNNKHRYLVTEQCRQQTIDPSAIILEPIGRSTAPAIALAALYNLNKGRDPILLVMPADHHLDGLEKFQKQIHLASQYASTGNLVTFGIEPNAPETAYGYLKAGKCVSELPDQGVYKIDCFEEKPNFVKAKAYLDKGNIYWNSGIFMFRASVYLEELKQYRPDIFTICEDAIAKGKTEQNCVHLHDETFMSCPEDSIDYAVMEKTKRAVLIPLEVTWNDVGSWNALCELAKKDSNNNHLCGDVIAVHTHNSYIRSEKRLVAALGVNNLAIIETADAILVAHKENVQDVKTIVKTIKQRNRKEHHTHLKVHRPWGVFEYINFGERYQVKRITVNPKASLSLQLHHHRSEHWIIVHGTALVKKDEEELLLTESQSIFIPIGAKHRVSNPGKVELEIIEVQIGSYLEEDDIIRYEDHYGRS